MPTHERGAFEPAWTQHSPAAPGARADPAANGQALGAAARDLGQPGVWRWESDVGGAARGGDGVSGLAGGDRCRAPGLRQALPEGELAPAYARPAPGQLAAA